MAPAQWRDSTALGTMRDVSAWLACISLNPLWELLRSWQSGESSDYVMWAEIGEGLLEGPASAVMTLSMILANNVTGDIWAVVSVISSCCMMAKTAIKLDDYGQQGSSQQGFQKLCYGLFVVVPRSLSRVITFAFAAYLTTFASI